MPENKEQHMKLSALLRRFLPYYRKYRSEMLLDLCCAMLTTLCEVVFPLIIRAITNQAVTDYTAITTGWVLKLGGMYILLRIIDAAANYFMQYWGHVTGSKLETDMRTDLFDHLQQLSFSYYNNTKIGQIMARITSDLFDVTEFAHHCPEEMLIAFVKITVSFVILCGMNVWLTLLIFVMLPFMLIGTRYFREKMRVAFKESRHQVGEINAQVEDSLLGVRVVLGVLLPVLRWGVGLLILCMIPRRGALAACIRAGRLCGFGILPNKFLQRKGPCMYRAIACKSSVLYIRLPCLQQL